MNLKPLARKFWNLPASAKLIIAGLALFVLFESFFFNREIQRLEKAADVKVKEADYHHVLADGFEKTRTQKEAEYKARKPLREKADREAEASKQNLDRAKKDYEKAINSNPDTSIDLNERERRAIRDAKELYSN